MRKAKKLTKRFGLVLPAEVHDRVEQIAEKHRTTPTEVYRKFTMLGLTAEEAKDAGGALAIRRSRDSKLQEIDIFGV